MELAAIAAVVIGGTSLMGGEGSVVRSSLGVLIIAVLQTGLAQVGATEPTKRVITGAVIVLAVIADVQRRSWARSARTSVGPPRPAFAAPATSLRRTACGIESKARTFPPIAS